MLPALLLDELENSANVLFVGHNHGGDHRLFDFANLTLGNPLRWIINVNHGPIAFGDAIAHARSSGNKIQIEFALEALLDNFHMEQAKKSAAESEAERGRALGLEEE